MIFKPGTDLFIYGVFYEAETQELEVYSRDYGWWGIPMTPQAAAKLVEKLKRSRVFFYEHVRHVEVSSFRLKAKERMP